MKKLLMFLAFIVLIPAPAASRYIEPTPELSIEVHDYHEHPVMPGWHYIHIEVSIWHDFEFTVPISSYAFRLRDRNGNVHHSRPTRRDNFAKMELGNSTEYTGWVTFLVHESIDANHCAIKWQSRRHSSEWAEM